MVVAWKRLLFASDFASTPQAAVDEVAMLGKTFDAEVILTNVQKSHWKTWLSSQLENRHRSDRLNLLADRFRSQGVVARTQLCTEPEVARTLVTLAKLEHVDAIIVGASESVQALKRTTAEAVLRASEHPVWVSRSRRIPPAHLLCGVDGSESSRDALRLADGLRYAFGARLTVIHAVGNPDFNPMGMSEEDVEARTQAHREEAVQRIQDFVAETGIQDVETRFIWGEPAAVLSALAEDEEVDLIVLGRTGVKGLRRFVLGSTAEYLLRHAVCSLLLLGEKQAPSGEPLPSDVGL